ncbi:hypothetical protein F5Y03DRAFT_2230 [Xylaria venustula]|nr:hypothetical protein F5Y03DRAFT_2230 [Xylaria venustula]
MSMNRVCRTVLGELMEKGQAILDVTGGPRSPKPAWETVEGRNLHVVVTFIFFILFRPHGTVYRKEASAIAVNLFDLTKVLGRIVHTSTRIDWGQALKCTCADR